MKRLFIYSTFVLLVGLASSCSENFEAFEMPEGTKTGTPSSISGITSEALPGQIVLKWDVPADSNLHLVQISYFDSLIAQKVTKVASIYTDSLLIDNTRAKFGDYEFSFQSFSADNIGGTVQTLKAKSGKAIATTVYTPTKIVLTADQLSTNNQEPSEGPIANLIDGSASSFFHTRWSSPQIPMPQYIQVNLKAPIKNFQFYYQNRSGSHVGPEILEVQVSVDGIDWVTLAKIEAGLPSAAKAEYTSEVFQADFPFTYFRYNVVQTYGSKNYFNLAEFALFTVNIQVLDPEL